MLPLPPLAPLRVAALVLGLLCAASTQAQAPAAGASTDEIVERERLRGEVAAVLEEYLAPSTGLADLGERANDLFDRIAARGRDFAPYLAEELDRDLPLTFDFCAIALGRMAVPEAAPALRRAIGRADEEAGEFPRSRKATAIWALGMAGDIDALDLMDQGRHSVVRFSVSHNTSLIEAVGILTAPGSIPPLLALAGGYLADEQRQTLIAPTLGALRRIGDPRTAPDLVELLDHPNRLARREAARALGAIDDPDAVRALFRAIASPDLGLRRTAAASIERLAPARQASAMAQRLKTEDDTITRGSLYRALARARGTRSLSTLKKYWGRGDLADRRLLAGTIADIRTPKAIALLREALSDQDAVVALRAVAGLGALGSGDAVEALVASVPEADPLVLGPLARTLAELHAAPAGPVLAERLFSLLQSGEPRDPPSNARAARLVDALLDVRYAAAAPRLGQAADAEADPGLAAQLRTAARLLSAVAEFGSDPERWGEAAGADDPDLRRLAYSRLGEIGGPESALRLEAAFEPEEPEGRIGILAALGETRAAAPDGLLSRLLASGEFDAPADLPLREMAAWAARRAGGPAMFALLHRAVERRHGRDAKITTYAALTGGRQALPLLRAHRLDLLRYIGWDHGPAQERLDRAAREIAAGIPLFDLDVPPNRLSFVP